MRSLSEPCSQLASIRSVAASLAIGILLWHGCGSAEPPADVEAKPGSVSAAVESDDDGAGHRRMLAVLRQIQLDTDLENEWQGEGVARVARRRLASLEADAPLKERWQRLKDVAYHELRLGNETEAIRRYREAYDLLPRLTGSITEDEANRTIFRLAVAHLRFGETQNCTLRHSAESCILPLRGAGIHVDPQGSTDAIRYLQQVLERTPGSHPLSAKSLWLLNIAYMTLGSYPAEVPERYRIPADVFGSKEEFPRFENIAPRLGIDSFNLFGGMVVDDFNGDGFLDVVTTTFDAFGQMRFFENDGAAAEGVTFTERTTEAGLEGLFGGLNIVQADYDNDGDIDLFVLRGAWLGAGGRHPNSLLRNDCCDADGHTTFTDVTFLSGLAQVSYPSQTASWADYDNDGDVDLFVGNERNDRLPEAPCQLFRNEGVGPDGRVTFTDVARQAGVDNQSFVKGTIWGDFDNDRFPDLYVSTLGGPNRLYHNNRDGTFSDVARELGVEKPMASFPVWFFDFDNDGNLDLYTPTYRGVVDGVAVVAASYFGLEIPWERPRLYQGNGRGGFRDVASELGLRRFHQAMGANFGDIDNDGYLDFYLGTGYPDYEAVMPNVMYRNLGGRGFVDVTLDGGFGHLQKGHAIAFADFDHDGDLDVFAQMGGAYPGDRFADALFENPGFGNHWIAIRLIGRETNRAAIGARLHLRVEENGIRRSIYRHVNSGGSFGSNPLRQTIGLGRASSIDRLEVYWPTTDRTQVFDHVEVDGFIEIVEGSDKIVRLDL